MHALVLSLIAVKFTRHPTSRAPLLSKLLPVTSIPANTHPPPAPPQEAEARLHAAAFARHYGWLRTRDLRQYVFPGRNSSLLAPRCAAAPLLVAVVSSPPANAAARQAIRETWGGPRREARVVFLMGLPRDDTVQVRDGSTGGLKTGLLVTLAVFMLLTVLGGRGGCRTAVIWKPSCLVFICVQPLDLCVV